MAQLHDEPRLGRCILTPKTSKRKPIEIPAGNWWAVEPNQADSTSTTFSARPRYVAPTAKMAPSPVQTDNAEMRSYSGKGKAQVTLPLLNQTSAPNTVIDATSACEKPILESDLQSDSQEHAFEEARRYQAQVDRVERRRDREDTTFNPMNDSQTQNVSQAHDTPRKRARKAAGSRAVQVPPVHKVVAQPQQAQQSAVQQQTSAQRKQQVPSVPQKRKADLDVPLENIQPPTNYTRATSSRPPVAATTNPDSEQKRYASDRHHNKRFRLLKPESQSKRKQYLKTITKHWKITSGQLMTFPYAPRRTTEPGQPILEPLDWNSGLLEAVAQLALRTKGDFAKACKFAKDAFDRSSPKGTKQLTAKVLLSSIAEQENGSGQEGAGTTLTQQHASETLQGSNGVQGAGVGHQGGRGDVAPYQAAGASGVRCDARSKTLSQQPSSPTSPTAKSTATTGQAPPSPAASPVTAPASLPADAIKREPADAVAQQDDSMKFGSQSSGTEERLTLESKERILSYQLAIVREQLETNERQKREKERRAARTRQLGSSPSQPLVL